MNSLALDFVSGLTFSHFVSVASWLLALAGLSWMMAHIYAGRVGYLVGYALLMLAFGYAVRDESLVPTALVALANAVLLLLSTHRTRPTYVLSAVGAAMAFIILGDKSASPFVSAMSGALLVLHGVFAGLYFYFSRKGERLAVKETPANPPANGSVNQRQDDDGLSSVPVQRARYTFRHIVGMEDTKARLLKAGRDATARNPGEEPRNGILLFGEPGNGKTFFAEALAGELKLPFLKLTYGDTASRWVNQTTEGVKKAFNDAKRHAPCMLFIDEVDSFLESREAGTSSGHSELNRTANTILTMINDLRASGVLLVAATNFKDKLDGAGTREGRFDFKVEVPPPDEEARRVLLRGALKNAKISEVSGVDRAAKRWEGFSVSRIRAVGKEAVEQAIRDQRTKISFESLMLAMRTIQGSLGDHIPEDTPGIDGVHLMAESAKKMRSIARRMIDIEMVEDQGGSIPSGVLFYGPPGTGKTFAARALAKESGWAFIATNGQELLSDQSRVQSLIKKARDIRPVIVFIDEADDVLADRSMNTWNKTVTNDLLTAIDGVKGKVPDIVWVAATNMPDALDSAVVRGGRFTEKILFDLPDETVMSQYISIWLGQSRAKFDVTLTPQALARMIGKVSLANVKAVLQTAVNNMISDGKDQVANEHVRAARNEVLMA